MELNTYPERAGTGKSYHMVKNIRQQMKENPLGDPVILTTPAQSTSQLEQSFTNGQELNGGLRTEVLHFKRLNCRTFQELRRLTKICLTKVATKMMIFNIAQQREPETKLYQPQADYYGFSEKLNE